MEKKQIILLLIIVVFGLGFYLAITMASFSYEDSYCGQYAREQKDKNYDICIQAGKTPHICESEAIDIVREKVQGMKEVECQEKLGN